MREVVIAGVGMHPFGRFDNKPYTEIGREAVVAALKDANVAWKQVQAAFCARMYLPATTGLRILSKLGLTGIPIVDVECACASGGASLRLAYQSVASGFYDIVLAFGVEKMPRGFMDPRNIYDEWQCLMGIGLNPMYWALMERRHMEDYGTTIEQIAQVSVKNHKNGALNPYAMYQKANTLEEVLTSRLVCDPTTLLMLCAPDEGAAAAVVCTREVANKLGARPVTIAASALKTALYPQRRGPTFSMSAKLDPPQVTTMAAREAYEMAGVGPEDLDVVELQDTDAFSEILYYEQLGLCQPGQGGPLVASGATEMGGKLPVNPSGGLISKGEPVGASALGQICELVWQLRGDAGPRQVAGAKVAMGHVVGAGDNCAVTILKR